MAYLRKTLKLKKRGKKGGFETRGQKRRAEQGLPPVETPVPESSSKKKQKDPETLPETKAKTKKAQKDPETLAESKPKTKKPTTKKERREVREKLPSVIKQKQQALEKKIAKESRAKKLEKKRRETAMKGIKLRRFRKIQESRKKKPKKSLFNKKFRSTKKMLSPIKESSKLLSPREYKSSIDKEILSGLEKSLLGLKISK